MASARKAPTAPIQLTERAMCAISRTRRKCAGMSAPDKPDAKLSAAGPAVDDFSRTKSPFCAYMARMTQGSVDRRAARTIASLQRAHLALIIDRGYDQTTVDDICAAAGVSRSAFYAHYRGKDDLKRSGLEQLKRTLLAAQRQALAHGAAFSFSLPLFEHARAHLDLYRALAGGRGGVVALGA